MCIYNFLTGGSAKQAAVGQHIWGYEKNCKNASPGGSHGEVHGFQHTKHAVALMGEQGAESIHAKFKLKLKSILKEYYLNAPLHMDQLQYRGP